MKSLTKSEADQMKSAMPKSIKMLLTSLRDSGELLIPTDKYGLSDTYHSRVIAVLVSMIGESKKGLLPLIYQSMKKNKVRAKEFMLACERVVERDQSGFYNWAIIFEDIKRLRSNGKSLEPDHWDEGLLEAFDRSLYTEGHIKYDDESIAKELSDHVVFAKNDYGTVMPVLKKDYPELLEASDE